MYEILISDIKANRVSGQTLVLAISGHGGAGKSTLAERLVASFGSETTHIVEVDGLHAKDYMGHASIFGTHDWPVIFEILKNAKTTGHTSYVARDYKGRERNVSFEQPQLLILEGIRLIRPETVPYFDVSVWIDCPIDVATARAKERNRLQGDSQAELDLWDTKWVPESIQYYDEVSPQKLASLVYRDN